MNAFLEHDSISQTKWNGWLFRWTISRGIKSIANLIRSIYWKRGWWSFARKKTRRNKCSSSNDFPYAAHNVECERQICMEGIRQYTGYKMTSSHAIKSSCILLYIDNIWSNWMNNESLNTDTIADCRLPTRNECTRKNEEKRNA